MFLQPLFFGEIIDWFEGLFEMIGSLIDLVVSLLTSLFDFISSIPTFVETITSAITSMPDLFLGFVGMSLTITVVFIIIGRSRSK